MQAVVLEVDRVRVADLAGVADQDLGLAQADLLAVDGGEQTTVDDVVGGHVGVAALEQRDALVQEVAAPGDDAVAAHLVVALAVLLGAAVLGDGVGAVEGVVQRAPTGVRGVDGEAGVEHGHDQLRAGGAGDLGVHVGGGHLVLARILDEVADLLEEGDVGVLVLLARVLAVVIVELGLQLVALGQQFDVARRVLLDDVAEALPEGVLVLDARGGKGGVVDEVVEDLGDLQAAGGDALGHCSP